MIHTTLAHLERYLTLHPRLETAFQSVAALANQPFQPGITEIEGREVYCNAFAYDTHTQETGQLEAHQLYIDVMYVKSGQEIIAWCPRERLKAVTRAYNPAEDALLADMQDNCSMLNLAQGDVAIFFPEDAHCPGITADRQQHVEKIVVKVKLS